MTLGKTFKTLTAAATALLLCTFGAGAAHAGPVAISGIHLDAADFGPITDGNSWWRENANANSIVKYVIAGSTLTLHYTVVDADGNPVAGMPVKLAQNGAATYTGDLAGTSDADGKVTFTLTSTNTDDNAESFRSDLNVWTAPAGAAVEADFIPYIDSPDYTGACGTSDNDAACGRDRVWTHVVASALPSVPTPEYNIRLSADDKASMTDKSYWWTNEAASHSMLKFVTAGDTLVLHYTVTDKDGNPAPGIVVSIGATPAGGTFTSDSMTGTTAEDGTVTFTLTNTNDKAVAEPRPVAPSTMSLWDDSRAVSPEYKYDIIPAIDGAIVHIDRVWTHIVKVPAPSAPRNISAVAGNGQATIIWDAPETDNGLPVTGYTVTSTPGDKTCISATLTCTITGLDNGTSYTFSATATSAVGDSVASDASNAVTPDMPVVDTTHAPGVISHVRVGTRTTTRVTLRWNAPADNGGKAITDYKIVVIRGSHSTIVNDGVSTRTSIRLTGLKAGTHYKVRISAINDKGTGQGKNISFVTKPAPKHHKVHKTHKTYNGVMTK